MFAKFAEFAKVSKHFDNILTKIEIVELCKGLLCVNLGESFQTHIFLQKLASMRPRTSPIKFTASARALSGTRSVTEVTEMPTIVRRIPSHLVGFRAGPSSPAVHVAGKLDERTELHDEEILSSPTPN